MALQSCFDHAHDGDTIQLKPGKYLIDVPLTIGRSLTLKTIAEQEDGCIRGSERNCATLAINHVAGHTRSKQMPIEVTAPSVTMTNIQILGMRGVDADYDRRICLNDSTRPAGGGIRVAADRFTMRLSVVAEMACYTGMEVVKGTNELLIELSRFSSNGSHSVEKMWSDGLTIHEVANARIERNTFVDNTDVQLILGVAENV